MPITGMQGEMMDSRGGTLDGLPHHSVVALTDLTLALLQDSGWCVHFKQCWREYCWDGLSRGTFNDWTSISNILWEKYIEQI